jgi:hypothetical protein
MENPIDANALRSVACPGCRRQLRILRSVRSVVCACGARLVADVLAQAS